MPTIYELLNTLKQQGYSREQIASATGLSKQVLRAYNHTTYNGINKDLVHHRLLKLVGQTSQNAPKLQGASLGATIADLEATLKKYLYSLTPSEPFTR